MRGPASASGGWYLDSTASQRRLAVLVGGLVGSAMRVGLSETWPVAPDAWPWPTFIVNVAGAFLLALLLPRITRPPTNLLAALLGVGVMGALTTFSLFVYEAWLMAEHGHPLLAAAYVGTTIATGLAVAGLGHALSVRGVRG